MSESGTETLTRGDVVHAVFFGFGRPNLAQIILANFALESLLVAYTATEQPRMLPDSPDPGE